MSFMLLGILNSQAAGGGGGAFDLLETTTLTSTASSVTLSGLGAYSDYKHLQIRMIARGTRSSGDELMLMRVNSNTSTSYNAHNLSGNGSAINANSNVTQNYIRNNMRISGASYPANGFAPMVMDILDFSSNSKYKTIRHFGGLPPGGGQEVTLGSGVLRSTAAITSLEFGFYLTGGSFAANTRFSIYGVK